MATGESIYRSPAARAEVHRLYDEILTRWTVAHRVLRLPTAYGQVNVISCGPSDGKPVLLLHASSMGATSWEPNVAALNAAGFRCYAVDYIGEANKSELSDPTRFPSTVPQVVELYSGLLDQLGIETAGVVGASAGAHVALRLAVQQPQRVSKLALLGPMGIRPLGISAIVRMMLVSMFPSQRRIDRTTRWAIGEDRTVQDQFGTWFRVVLRAVASPPRVARPVALKAEELCSLRMPVLLVLGDHDNLVGNPRAAAQRAEQIPHLTVEVVHSGHLVGVEQASRVNSLMVTFLTAADT